MACGHKFLDTMNIYASLLNWLHCFSFLLLLLLLLLCYDFIFIICLIRNIMRLDFEVGLHRDWHHALFFKRPPTHVCLSLLSCDSLAYRRQPRRGHPKFSSCYAATGKDLPLRLGFVTQFSEWNMLTFFAVHPCCLIRDGLRERASKRASEPRDCRLHSAWRWWNLISCGFCLGSFGWHCHPAGRDYWIITQYKETCWKWGDGFESVTFPKKAAKVACKFWICFPSKPYLKTVFCKASTIILRWFFLSKFCLSLFF